MSGILSLSKFSLTNVRRFFLFLTALIVSVTVLAPPFNTTDASAAKPYSTMTLEELGKSGAYYVTLQGCIANNMYGGINAESPYYDPMQISWFNGGSGYVYPEGKLECKAIMSKALTLWNITPENFLKGLGYTQPNKSLYNWVGTADGGTRNNNFVVFAKSGSVTSSSDPANIGGAAAYQRYDSWWDKNCAVKKLGRYDAIKDSVIKARVDSGETVVANVNTSARTSVTQKYGTIARTNGVKWAYLYNESFTKPAAGKTPYDFIAYGYESSPRNVTCQETAAALTDYADDYVVYLNQKSLKTICQNKGYTDTQGSRADDPNPVAGVPALTACINGYNNKNSIDYCDDKYKDAVLNAACEAGAGITDKEIADGAAEIGDNESVDSDVGSGAGESSCGVAGIGWLICPVVSFMGDLLGEAFKGIADNFLRTDIALFDTSSGTYVGWGVFRSIANVAFVIAFLIIIFSQLTGVGVTNYGVKKMLPRLVIAAILVNLSFFVCQLAVDLSNVAGYSLKSVFDGIASNTGIPTSTDASANGYGITAIVVAVLGAAVVSYFALGVLIPVLLSALVAVLVIVLILILRKALIVLLIVLSPLAFVAFLLPNTEKFFTTWRKGFVALLLVFPIIAVVFGAASLASQILLNTDPGNVSIQIAAVGAAALPFIVVPSLLKKSLDGIPAIGKMASKLSSQADGNLKKSLGESYKGSVIGQGNAGRKRAREEFSRRKSAERIANGGVAGVLAGGTSNLGITKRQRAERDAVRNNAKATMAGAESEELKHASLALENELANVPIEERDDHLIRQARTAGTEIERTAALHKLASGGRDGALRKLMDTSNSDNATVDQSQVRKAMDANGGALVGKAPDLVKGAAGAFGTAKGADVASFSGGTAEQYMAHLKSLSDTYSKHAPGTEEHTQAKESLEKAITGFNASMQDIQASADLQSKFGFDTGLAIKKGAQSLPPEISSLMSLSAIKSDGKIR